MKLENDYQNDFINAEADTEGVPEKKCVFRNFASTCNFIKKETATVVFL